MRIHKRQNMITLGRDETKKWEDGGPIGYDFRSRARSLAKDLAKERNRNIEIYACARSGGWLADVAEAYNG